MISEDNLIKNSTTKQNGLEEIVFKFILFYVLYYNLFTLNLQLIVFLLTYWSCYI